MTSQYVQGYTDEVDHCPYCGGQAGTYYADGRCECRECGSKFFVIEAEDSKRKIDNEEDA